jgi:hypothetical protein
MAIFVKFENQYETVFINPKTVQCIVAPKDSGPVCINLGDGHFRSVEGSINEVARRLSGNDMVSLLKAIRPYIDLKALPVELGFQYDDAIAPFGEARDE